MGMFDTINIAASGMSAERLRLDVIANNIANASSTRSVNGDGPFRRDQVVLTPINERNLFFTDFLPSGLKPGLGRGVKVEKIQKDMRPFNLRYEPNHPDAISYGAKKGYVEMPNVNIVEEITDMIGASRAYEANAQVLINHRQMFNKTLEIGRG